MLDQIPIYFIGHKPRSLGSIHPRSRRCCPLRKAEGHRDQGQAGETAHRRGPDQEAAGFWGFDLNHQNVLSDSHI